MELRLLSASCPELREGEQRTSLPQVLGLSAPFASRAPGFSGVRTFSTDEPHLPNQLPHFCFLYVVQAGLKLSPPALASWVLGLQVCATTPGLEYAFFMVLRALR
jgi:hypothetical protein